MLKWECGNNFRFDRFHQRVFIETISMFARKRTVLLDSIKTKKGNYRQKSY